MKKLFILLIVSVLLFGCLQPYPPTQPNATTNTTPTKNLTNKSNQTTTVANPAATYCKNMNYDYTLENQTGYCSKGKSVCEEWKLLRGECCLQDNDCSNKTCADGVAYCSSKKCWCPKKQKNVTNTSTFFPPKTNKSMLDLMHSYIDELEKEIYTSMSSGTSYNRNHANWTLTVSGSTQPPEEITLGSIPMPNHIFINNKTEDGLRGFAYTIYTPETAGYKPLTMGLGIFLNTPKVMEDSKQKATQFRVHFKPPQHNKLLENCIVKTKHVWKLDSGTILYIYNFECAIAWNG